jgi:hypothetical protein
MFALGAEPSGPTSQFAAASMVGQGGWGRPGRLECGVGVRRWSAALELVIMRAVDGERPREG